MQKIDVHIINADEARLLLESSHEKMRGALLDLSQNLHDIAVNDIVKDNNIVNSSLTDIRTQLNSLQEYISDNETKSLDGKQLSQLARGIVEQFIQLDYDQYQDVTLKEGIIEAGTVAVLINAYAREIMAIEPYLKRKPGSRSYFRGWTVDGERKRLTEEFRARFPIFSGYKLEINVAGDGFSIHLIDPLITPLKPVPNKDVLKALVLKASEFLKRELVNNPMSFCFDTKFFPYDSEYGNIFCTIVLARNGDCP